MMFQAIEVKYLGCTNTKPSRFKASCAAGSMTRSYDYGLNADDNAIALATALADKFGWLEHCSLVGGVLKSGLRVFVLTDK